MLRKKKISLGDFGRTMKGVDLKKIAGILLPFGGTDGNVKILFFEGMVSVREKVTAVIPEVSGEAVSIQSVAIMPDGNVLFTITGNLTTQMRSLVGEIASIIKRDGLNGAYFPAYAATSKIDSYIGLNGGTSSVKKLPEGMKNVQPFSIKKDGILSEGVIFTHITSDYKIVKEIPLSALYEENTLDLASVVRVMEGRGEIFIDRIEGSKTLLTFGGDIFMLDLETKGIKKVSPIPGVEPSAALRLNFGVLAVIADKGKKITTFPRTTPECRAIAKA